MSAFAVLMEYLFRFLQNDKIDIRTEYMNFTKDENWTDFKKYIKKMSRENIVIYSISVEKDPKPKSAYISDPWLRYSSKSYIITSIKLFGKMTEQGYYKNCYFIYYCSSLKNNNGFISFFRDEQYLADFIYSIHFPEMQKFVQVMLSRISNVAKEHKQIDNVEKYYAEIAANLIIYYNSLLVDLVKL